MSENPRLLSRVEMNRIVTRVMGFVKEPSSSTHVTITGWWNAELQWARNRVSLAGDRRDVVITVSRAVAGRFGTVSTNQSDDVSLEAAVHAAERAAEISPSHKNEQMSLDVPELPSPTGKIWSDSTANVTIEQRANIARQLTVMSEDKGLLSAGYLEMRAGEVASFDSTSRRQDALNYQAFTQAQCSATVRHTKGLGSGWAGLSSYDWSSIDGMTLVQRAVEKCEASINPVAIEPGRYTAILEPQAVSELTDLLVNSLDNRDDNEGNKAKTWSLDWDPSLRLRRTKLGLKVVDERISISHDPQHPELGVLPAPGLAPIEWIKNGVLNTLSYNREYALAYLIENQGNLWRPSYVMSGGETSMDEMIATTKRGLIVTRFWKTGLLDPLSILCTGITRDGLWLVENGKITKAVKNFRFTESPLFILNQVVQVGPAVRVFRPVKNPYDAKVTPAIVPTLKVNDFSFTSLIDAV